MDLSIITINYNTEDLLEKLLISIKKFTKGLEYEVIVVDNGSTRPSVDVLKKLKKTYGFNLVENNRNLGFAAGNNSGAAKAKGKYLLFLNSDTQIKDNIFKDIFLWMDKHPGVGVVSCALRGVDGKLQGTGGYFPNLLRVFSWMTIQDIPLIDKIIRPFHPMKDKSFSGGESYYKKRHQFDWLTGAFMFMRREVFEEIGGWDESFFMYTEDTDVCYRIKKAGWQVWYLPQWEVTHIGGASSTKEFPILKEYEGVKLFYKKHYPSWQMPFLRLFLKIGALGRIILFGILEGPQSAKIYGQAFKQA